MQGAAFYLSGENATALVCLESDSERAAAAAEYGEKAQAAWPALVTGSEVTEARLLAGLIALIPVSEHRRIRRVGASGVLHEFIDDPIGAGRLEAVRATDSYRATVAAVREDTARHRDGIVWLRARAEGDAAWQTREAVLLREDRLTRQRDAIEAPLGTAGGAGRLHPQVSSEL